MRLFGQRCELGLDNVLVDHVELDGQTKATRRARADGDGTGDYGALRVRFLLGGDIVDRPAKTGRIAGGKQMLGSRRPRLARAAHFLGNRQVDADGPIFSLRVTIASARGRGPRGEQRFDFHRQYPFANRFNRPEGYAGFMTAESGYGIVNASI